MTTATAKTTEKEDELAASKEAAMDAYEKLLEAKGHFRKAAEAAGIDLKHDAIEQLLKGKEKASELGKQADAYMKEKPLNTLGIAFAAGFILAQLFSRR